MAYNQQLRVGQIKQDELAEFIRSVRPTFGDRLRRLLRR